MGLYAVCQLNPYWLNNAEYTYIKASAAPGASLILLKAYASMQSLHRFAPTGEAAPQSAHSSIVDSSSNRRVIFSSISSRILSVRGLWMSLLARVRSRARTRGRRS